MIRFSHILLVFFFATPAFSEEIDIKALKELYKRPEKLVIYPEGNSHSDIKSELGKKLFFDPRLSSTDIMGCHTCHNPSFHWTDGLAEPRGKNWHLAGSRKTMSILNVGSDELILWDGVANNLEEHPQFSLPAARGTDISLEEAASKIHTIKEYRALFKKAFDTAKATPEVRENDFINKTTIPMALATFQRTVFSGKSSFDEWVEGDEKAISESAKRGFVVFNTKGKCSSCHTGWNLSGEEWVDIGVDDNPGRGMPLSNEFHFDKMYQFKPVGLRNIAERPPYFHNGMYDTLEEVIEFFDRGGNVRQGKTQIEPLNLTGQEKQDLAEFLKSLTSTDDPVVIPQLPR